MEKQTVRRSVALPQSLVDEALQAAPLEINGNLNLLVKEALKEYIVNRRESEFELAMEAMAADPAIQEESRQINQLFMTTEMDGL